MLGQQHGIGHSDVAQSCNGNLHGRRVDMVNNRHTTIVDPLIAEYLAHHNLDLRATTDPISIATTLLCWASNTALAIPT
jgi:UDP-glucose 6-dehydrogenase